MSSQQTEAELVLYEQSLLATEHDLNRLTILSTSCPPKLQYVRHRHRMHIESSSQNAFLRLFFFALLDRIYSDQHCSAWLFTLKKMVYGAKLSAISKQCGLETEELHRTVAVELRRIQQKSGRGEDFIMAIFNNTPFFDEILIQAFQEHENCLRQDDENKIRGLIKRYFGIDVILSSESLRGEKGGLCCQNQMSLNVDKQNKITKISRSLSISDSSNVSTTPTASLEGKHFDALHIVDSFSNMSDRSSKENIHRVANQVSVFRNSDALTCRAPRKSKGFSLFFCCSD